MANPIEDFIISLGFDTSKIAAQIKKVHQDLEKLAVKTDNTRVKSGLVAQKQISTNEIKETKKTVAAKEKILSKADKDRIEREKQTTKQIGETRRQAALRQLRNQIAEAERNTVGPSNLSQRYKYYEKGRASIAKIAAFTEQLRGSNQDTRNRLKASGLLSSFDSSSAARDQLNMSRAKGNLDVARLRMSKLGLSTADFDQKVSGATSVSEMKQILQDARNTIALQKELMRTQKATVATQVKSAKLQQAATGPNSTNVNQYIAGLQSQGRIPVSLAAAIQQGAMRQSTQKGAEQFINQAARASRYNQQGVGNRAEIAGILSTGNRQAVSDLNNQLSATHAKMAAIERRSIGAAAAMGGMRDSARNMVREMASVYAILASTTYAKEQVKALDSMNASVLAVSDSAEQSATTVEYLKGVIKQNGLSLKDTTKDFVKLRAAMQDQHSLKETQMAFESLTKSGVILQLSQDDMSGTVKAVSQMFSKQGIYAQELKEQLGDRLPIAMRALSASTGKTSKQLFKLMETGQLSAEYILPFVLQMEKLLDVNNAYRKSLEKLGVVENRMKTAFSITLAEKLDEGGFTKGLVNFYKTLTDSVENNGETLVRIGRIYEKVFNFLANATKLATRFIEGFVRSIESVWDTIQWGLDNPIVKWMVAIPLLTGVMVKFASIMAIAFRTPYMILGSILTVIDQIRAAFDADLIGWGENANASKEDRDLATAAFKVKMGVATAKEMSMVGMATPEQIAKAQANSGGMTAWFGANNSAQMLPNILANSAGMGGMGTFANTFGGNRTSIMSGLQNVGGSGGIAGAFLANPVIAGVVSNTLALGKTGYDYAAGGEKKITVNQNITVQGNMSEDNVRQVKQAVESITSMETVSSR